MQGQLTMQMKIKLPRGGGGGGPPQKKRGGRLPYEKGEDARPLA